MWKKLMLAGLCATLAGFTTSPLRAADVVFKLAHEAPETAIKGRTAKLLADLIEKYTNGAVKVEVFPGGQLVPTVEEIRAAVRGQVDIIAPYTSYYSSIDNLWDIFYQPMLFKTPQQAIEVFSGEVGQSLLAKLDSRGLKGLGIWIDGPVYAFTRGEPAVTPSVMKSMKMRVAPSKPLEALLQKAGAAPISMPATEVYLALQQNVANGVVSTPTYAAPAKWGEVLTAMTRGPLWGLGGYGLAMNKRSWEKLSPVQQEGLLKAVAETTSWNHAQALENIKAAEKALADGGMKIVDLTPADAAVWTELAKTVWATQSDEIKALVAKIQK